jgi:hypothetical protein
MKLNQFLSIRGISYSREELFALDVVAVRTLTSGTIANNCQQ